ncbi:MAG: LytR C-terminal domain-containing protein [Patescibacteria group bacterium]
MEEAVFPYSNPVQQPKSKKPMTALVISLIVLVALIGGFILMKQPKKVEEKKDIVVEEKGPSPTEKPKIEKSTVKIQVVNGTGTPGQAGVVVKALESAGYSADNIKTGNAEKFDNATTSITARDNFEEIVNDIKSALGSTFDKITVVSPNLSADSEFDIIVVTGGKAFVEATPTASVTITETPTLSPTATPTLTPTPTP